MYRNTKVATCTYCGTRAALLLDEGRHELACARCGAPLHDLKQLPVRRDREAPARPEPPRPRPHSRPPHWERDLPSRSKTKKKPKKRKSLARKLLKEAVDLIEDIFD